MWSNYQTFQTILSHLLRRQNFQRFRFYFKFQFAFENQTFTVEMDGQFVGEVGIYHPDHFPGPEFGWMVTPEAEGKGIAHEAAGAALGWVRQTFDWPFITSIIEEGNARSIALALRLGGVIDASLPGVDEGDVVIRHDLRGRA